MNKKLTILFLMAATFVVLLPTSSAALSPGDRNVSGSGFPLENIVLEQKRGRGKKDGFWEQPGRRRNGRWYGYKNYGQYRRTQVGNRRYRLVRRYYWDDGRRYYIWRRIYY